MYDASENIYRHYREAAGLTKEKAAELLDISVSSLSNYERFIPGSNKFKCPGEVVLRMENVYHSRELLWRYLSEYETVGRVILPKIKDVPLSNAFLRLMIEQDDVEALEKELAKISSDDIVHPGEAPVFNKAVNEIWGMIEASVSFIFAGVGNTEEAIKKPEGGQYDKRTEKMHDRHY